MANYVGFEDAAPDGQHFSEEVRDEIRRVSPESPPDGSINVNKLANNAVTEAKIDEEAVTTPKIKDLNVTTSKLANDSVTEEKIENGAVTGDKAGYGVPVAIDQSNEYILLRFMPISADDYAAIVGPNPDTLYLIPEE